ncbi:MAG: hypothetical protein U0802_03670 [Candidatus Binatia bacterium]
MRTVKRNPLLAGLCAVLGGVALTAASASADVTSDRAAGLIVIPKLVVDSEGDLGSLTGNGNPVDTEIQMTNVSDQDVKLRCFYVNANSHCSNAPAEVCSVTADCQQFGRGGLCFEGWIETDFEITMTPHQPLIWRVSEGLFSLPLADQGQLGSIPGASEDPFQGELKCVQVGPDDAPVDRNDIKAEVTILEYSPAGIDARSYNGIGLQAVSGANDGDNTLVLGGEDPEYSGCPNVLILNHFFDDAQEPVTGNYLKTHLTLVPCSQNFLLQDAALFNTTVQFLVFNEFEQRFSASRSVRCFKEFELCSLGTGVDRAIDDYAADSNSCQRSVFSAFVNGTLSGQTRIRGVDDGSAAHGNGLLGVAEEFYRSSETDLNTVQASDAFNIHYAGDRATPDFITMP